MSVEHKKTITAHCIIKNEENFVDFAIRSVINFVDFILVFDTGSTDQTVPIIKKLAQEFPGRIVLEQKGECDKARHSVLRQEMLGKTFTDWFMLLDGDEVWTKRGMEEAISAINICDDSITWLVSPYYLCVGDIFHTYKKEWFDKIYGRPGFLTPRFIKRQNNIEWRGFYEQDTLYYKDTGKNVYDPANWFFLANYYWHLSHLKRSSKDDKVYTSGIAKNRREKRRLTYHFIGKPIAEDPPEVFGGHPSLKLTPVRSIVNFVLLLVKQPKLLIRKFYCK